MGKSPFRGISQPLRAKGGRDECTLERVPFLTHVDLRTAAQRLGAWTRELKGAADSDEWEPSRCFQNLSQ
jgi:hypothetical protein